MGYFNREREIEKEIRPKKPVENKYIPFKLYNKENGYQYQNIYELKEMNTLNWEGKEHIRDILGEIVLLLGSGIIIWIGIQWIMIVLSCGIDIVNIILALMGIVIILYGICFYTQARK